MLALGGNHENAMTEIQPPLPDAVIQILPPATTGTQAHDAIAMFLAGK